MAGPHPDVAAARHAVREALTRALGGRTDRPDVGVLVACSGGADSLALAAATAFVAPRLGLAAGAVVVDHGLQAGSDRVAERAADQCRELGLDATVRRVEVVAAGVGPEAAARNARYGALEAARVEAGASVVLLGHTMDDQAESVLLGLARGSGARSLAGMARTRGSLVRPFLGLRRAQTEAVCRVLGLEFWMDPTNGPAPLAPAPAPGSVVGGAPGLVAGGAAGREDPLPTRSRLRAQVMPALVDVLGAGVVPGLARTADLLRDDADLLDGLAAELLARAREEGRPEGQVILDVGVLAGAHPALRRRALRAAALEVGCPPGDLFAVHVDAMDALVTRWRGQGPASLPCGRSATRSCGRLWLRPPHLEE